MPFPPTPCHPEERRAPNPYDTYTQDERDAMIRDMEKDLAHKRWVAGGNACLRSGIARSTVRTLERQLVELRTAGQK